MLRIDLVSDFSCPWCFIGARRLAQVLREDGRDAEINFHPFLLNPDLPAEGADLRDYLRNRYGGEPQEMFARVEAAAHDAGIPLDFARLSRFPNTVAAHTLVRHAPTPTAQVALAEALFAANFLEGRDLGDHALLTSLATSHGFAAADVTRLLHDADEQTRTQQIAAALSARGITGVPFFIFGQKVALSGAQPPDVLRQAIAQADAP
jgi:predicted DsbA family dithiol-disulfide isomerase